MQNIAFVRLNSSVTDSLLFIRTNEFITTVKTKSFQKSCRILKISELKNITVCAFLLTTA